MAKGYEGTEQYAKDLAAFKAEQAQIKVRAFDYMRDLARMSDEELAACGHRNGLGKALESVLESKLKELNTKMSAFLRKYPD